MVVRTAGVDYQRHAPSGDLKQEPVRVLMGVVTADTDCSMKLSTADRSTLSPPSTQTLTNSSRPGNARAAFANHDTRSHNRGPIVSAYG